MSSSAASAQVKSLQPTSVQMEQQTCGRRCESRLVAWRHTVKMRHFHCAVTYGQNRVEPTPCHHPACGAHLPFFLEP
eukprot:364430-Chlamydomonas_euryale.AAC.9